MKSPVLSLACLLVSGPLFLGCGGGGSSGGDGGGTGTTSGGGTTSRTSPRTSGGGSGGGSVSLDPQAVSEVMRDASLAALTATDVALQAALAQMVPATFLPPTGVALVANGTPTSGTVLVDFGSGSLFNKLFLTGALHVTWTETGPGSWTVTISFTQFGVDSFLVGSTIDGDLTIAVSLTGSSATASVVGSLTHTSTTILLGTDTLTVTPNVTYAKDGATGISVLDGSVDIDNSDAIAGDWAATARSLTFASDDVQSGEVELERTSFPSLSVEFVFTAPNQGTWSLSPLGVFGTFSV